MSNDAITKAIVQIANELDQNENNKGKMAALVDLVFAYPSTIAKTYSGRPGCMCGCNGNYIEPTSKAFKGQCSKIYGILRDNLDAVTTGKACRSDTSVYLAVECGNRQYAVYTK